MPFEDVTDPNNFIWAHWHGFDEAAGVLWVKATGYDVDEHWTGIREFPMDHSEYGFWACLVSDPGRRILNGNQIASARLEFASLARAADDSIVFEPLPDGPA